MAVVPREMVEGGYADLHEEDGREGGLISDLQKVIANVSVRVGTK